jgi:hypothetical protein
MCAYGGAWFICNFRGAYDFPLEPLTSSLVEFAVSGWGDAGVIIALTRWRPIYPTRRNMGLDQAFSSPLCGCDDPVSPMQGSHPLPLKGVSRMKIRQPIETVDFKPADQSDHP